MNVTAFVDLEFPDCDDGHNCEAIHLHPVRVAGTVHETAEGYAIEVLDVFGLPYGLALCELHPETRERLQAELEKVAERRFEAMRMLPDAIGRVMEGLRMALKLEAPVLYSSRELETIFLLGAREEAILSAVAMLGELRKEMAS